MNHLSDALDSFRCCADEDMETFLRQKTFQFLERGWCSVYLILDEQEFDAGHIKISAYFTLSHKSLIPGDVPKRKVKDAGGFKDAQSIHFVLIGHLGKYIERYVDGKIVSDPISGKEILDFAFEVIRSASGLIPCRCVMVECNDNGKVHKVYTDYGFTFFPYDGEHHQFYKRI